MTVERVVYVLLSLCCTAKSDEVAPSTATCSSPDCTADDGIHALELLQKTMEVDSQQAKPSRAHVEDALHIKDTASKREADMIKQMKAQDDEAAWRRTARPWPQAWVLTLGSAVGVHGRPAAQGGQAGADPSVLAAGLSLRSSKSWTGLGDKNWWMPFIDGWAHKCGASAFDHAEDITWGGGDGDLSGHLKSLYTKFSDADVMYKVRLNHSSVGSMNLELQGVSESSAHLGYKHNNIMWLHGGVYTDWQPRKDDPPGDMMGYRGAVNVPDKKEMYAHMEKIHDWSDVSKLLVQDPLDEFYKAISKGDCGVSHSDENPHPRAALGCLLPAAATLYATLAELHPFADGNSRTRTMVLQTQLTRAGAHPVVLYNNGWAAYHMNNLEELEEYLLGGYCAWEYVAATGKLPYEGHEPSFDCSNQPGRHMKGNQPVGGPRDMERMGANASPFPFYDSKKDECLKPPTTS